LFIGVITHIPDATRETCAVNRRLTPHVSSTADLRGLTAGIQKGNTSDIVARRLLVQGDADRAGREPAWACRPRDPDHALRAHVKNVRTSKCTRRKGHAGAEEEQAGKKCA
jgi:hypothetical protein